MDKIVKRLVGWENEAYLWVEQQSSIMVKVSSEYNDPLELSSNDARLLASLLNKAADELDSFDE